MKPPSSASTRLFCGILLLLLSGCGIPVSTMHGPVPLPVHTGAATVGLAPVFPAAMGEEDFLATLLIFGGFSSLRYGVSERLEVGASTGMLNGFTAEAKYNLIPGPLFVSANLALSSGVIVDIDFFGGSETELVGNVGIHPALLVGTERVYGGAKLMIYPDTPHLRPWQVLFVGGSFGGNTRLVPEIAWMRDPADGQTEWLLGIALQQRVNQIFR